MIYLLCFALFVLPLVGTVSIIPLISFKELWQSKEAVALLFIVTMCLIPSSYRQHTINPWVKYLVGFLVVFSYLVPPIKLQFGPADLGGLWVWRGMFWVFVYFFLYRKIVQLPILHADHKNTIAKSIGYAALISSIYALLQWCNLDQFQAVFTQPDHGVSPSAEITAMIGAPVYLAVFLGMCVPFCLYALRWWQTAIVLVSILLCNSDTTNIFVPFVVCVYYSLRAKSKIWFKIIVLVLCAGSVFTFLNYDALKNRLDKMASGRFPIWKETVQDWRSPCLIMDITEDMPKEKKEEIARLNKRTWALTGRGLGSYEFLFQRKHPGWNDPHNAYLRALYEIGLVGLFLLLGMIGYVLFRTFPLVSDPWVLTIFCAFLFVILSAMTIPILIIEPLRFYAVFLFSMLSSLIPRRERH